jgi:hypothetical protein
MLILSRIKGSKELDIFYATEYYAKPASNMVSTTSI